MLDSEFCFLAFRIVLFGICFMIAFSSSCGVRVYLKDGCDCDHTVTVKVLHRDPEDDSVIFISVQHHQNISK